MNKDDRSYRYGYDRWDSSLGSLPALQEIETWRDEKRKGVNKMEKEARPNTPPEKWRQFTSEERAIVLDKLKEPQKARTGGVGEDGSMWTDVQRMMITNVEEALEDLNNPDNWCLARDNLKQVCLMLEVASEFQVLAENLHEFLDKEGGE